MGLVALFPFPPRNIKTAIDELLSQQFCTGRALQLLVGHCTWAMMTRREGLSILNSTYAFIHQHGFKSARLWPSVRQELCWISSLLPLFRMKINSGWAEDVTASDSSPWGLGVCSRKLDVNTVADIGSQSERWRYKFEDSMQARQRALETNPAKETNSGGGNQSIGSFILDQGFNEVDAKLMDARDWQAVWSRPWRFKANILNTEARALVWSVEHLLRANRCIGKKLLCFSDNMPLVLGCIKGRAKSSHLLRFLRQIAALCLAVGSKVSTRWVVSEHNVADRPSRAIGAWQSAGLERWWADQLRGPSGDSGESLALDHAQLSRKQRKEAERSFEESFSCGSSRGHDLPGVKECQVSNSEGLSDKGSEVFSVGSESTTLSGFGRSHGFSSGGIHSRVVHERAGHRRRHSDSCSHSVFSSFGKARHFAEDREIAQRVEPRGANPSAIASSNRGSGSHHGDSLSSQSSSVSPAFVSSVYDLHEARRMFKSEGEASCTPSDNCGPMLQSVCNTSSSHRGQHSWKDRGLRCNSAGRQRCVALPSAGPAHQAERTRGPFVGPTSQSSCRRVCQGSKPAEPRSSQQLPLYFASRWSNSRHLDAKKVDARSEAARQVELRRISETICEISQTSDRVSQGSHASPRIRIGSHARSSNDSNPKSQGPPETRWNSHITKRMRKKAKTAQKQSLRSGASLLKQAFRQAMKSCKGMSRKIFFGFILW